MMGQFMMHRCVVSAAWCISLALVPCCSTAQSSSDSASSSSIATKQTPAEKKAAQKQVGEKTLSPAEELQKAISDAGNDRAALVKNLQVYLEKYPSAPERPQIYRALVEACIQFHDDTCATMYAERIVALTPEDTSMTLLAIQMLERTGDTAGVRRAGTYATRGYDAVRSTPPSGKTQRGFLEEREGPQKRDETGGVAV